MDCVRRCVAFPMMMSRSELEAGFCFSFCCFCECSSYLYLLPCIAYTVASTGLALLPALHGRRRAFCKVLPGPCFSIGGSGSCDLRLCEGEGGPTASAMHSLSRPRQVDWQHGPVPFQRQASRSSGYKRPPDQPKGNDGSSRL